MSISGPLGLIAGYGELPLVVCRTARERGVDVVAVAFDKETGASLKKVADVSVVGPGQAGKVIERLKSANVKHVCLIGKIEKSLIFKNPKLDFRTLKMMKRLMSKSDTNVMLVVIEELEREGIKVVKQTDWLPDIMPKKGILGKIKPKKNVSRDFEFGMKICRDIARNDIGQSIIVKEGVVLSVEAVEGTNVAIERGCSLGNGGAVMIKTSRPKQDFRYDIPSVGSDTIKLLAKHKAAGLAVEAGRTVIIDMEKTVSMCNKAGIVFAAL